MSSQNIESDIVDCLDKLERYIPSDAGKDLLDELGDLFEKLSLEHDRQLNPTLKRHDEKHTLVDEWDELEFGSEYRWAVYNIMEQEKLNAEITQSIEGGNGHAA